jgi:molybdopterin biosynthesis enzyme
VLAHEALERQGSFLTATDDPAPGTDTHATAADIAAGDAIARAGTLLRAHHVEGVLASGGGPLNVVRPSIVLAATGSRATMLAAARARRGIGVTATASVRIELDGDVPRAPDVAGIALAGAEMVTVSQLDDEVTIHCPPVMPAVLAVALVLVPRLLGVPVMTIPTRLGAKITSRVGTSDVALLAVGPDGAVALNSGYATLRALLGADRLLVSAPESEGAPAGAVVIAEGLV